MVFLQKFSWSLEKVETHYPDGPIKERFFVYKNDSGFSIKGSIYREFHPSSEFRHRHENGQLHLIVSFKDGYLNGPAKWYHANGELAFVGYQGDYGEREFLWQLYRDNGEKCAKTSYSNDVAKKKEYYVPTSRPLCKIRPDG